MIKRIYLQLFAEGEPNTEAETKPEAEPEKKYSDEDVDRIISARFAKWQKEQEKAKKEQDEAARLEKLSKEEKEAERVKGLEAKIAELEAKEKRSSMMTVARSMLKEQGITVDDELVTMIIGTDADGTNESVKAFAKAFKKAVADSVKEAMKGSTPKASTAPATLTKEEILKEKDPKKRQALISENLSLWRN